MKRDPLPVFLTIVTSVVALDRLTKLMALALLEQGKPAGLLPYLRLTLVTNTGISFGMLKDFPWLAFAASLLVISGIAWSYRRLPRHWVVQTACALIMAGAIGNLWDRIVYGTVIDFIDLVVWPVFNVADSAVTVGGVLLAYWCFFVDGKKK